MEKKIRKHIRKILSESYDSINEIKELSNDVLRVMARQNSDYVKRQKKQGIEDIRLYPTKLLDVYQEFPKKYPTLANFLTNSNILVMPIYLKKDTNVKGNYTYTDEENYDTTRSRDIRLYYGNKFIESLSYKMADGKELGDIDLFSTLYYAFHSILSHEIQHAYDDFRSNSKLYQTKKAKNFFATAEKTPFEDIPSADWKKQAERNKKYLNLQHEIWARFTQTIKELRFYKMDFALDKDNDDYITYEIYPILEVVQDMRRNFSGWNLLTPKMKRKLIGKTAQFWHKKLEELPAKNEKEMEDLKKRKEEKLEPVLAENSSELAQFLYHGTYDGAGHSIQREGKLKSNTASADQKLISFSAKLKVAEYYTTMKGGKDRGIILRTPMNDEFVLSPKFNKNDGYEYTSEKDIPIERLEILGYDKNWYPLINWDFIDKKPLNETRSQSDNKYKSCYHSDLIRMDIIELFLNKIKSEQNHNIQKPNLNMLLDVYNGYDDNSYIQNNLKNNEIIYFEGWVNSCWEGAYSKQEYKNLTKEEILEKIVNERFTKIAVELNLKIKSYKNFLHSSYKKGWITKIVFEVNNDDNKIGTGADMLFK